MNQNIKFVYCDIGGVLFDESGSKHFLKEYSLDNEKFRQARNKYLTPSLRGELTADKTLILTLKSLNLESNIADYNDYWTKNSKPIPEAQEMLTKIATHYPVGLLTNNMKDSLPYYKK
mgnify:CR=1 FL=1